MIIIIPAAQPLPRRMCVAGMAKRTMDLEAAERLISGDVANVKTTPQCGAVDLVWTTTDVVNIRLPHPTPHVPLQPLSTVGNSYVGWVMAVGKHWLHSEYLSKDPRVGSIYRVRIAVYTGIERTIHLPSIELLNLLGAF